MQQEKATPTGPIKQYEVFRPSAFHKADFQIRQNGRTILVTKKSSHIFQSPAIQIALQNGPILAAVKLQSFTHDLLLYFGNNTDDAGKSQWILLNCSGWVSKQYIFPCDGRSFSWTRTRNSDLGASRWTGTDFKLQDRSTGQILAVYRTNGAIFKGGSMAVIDYYVELGQRLELLSLAAILGIELQIERNKASSRGSAAGAGAASMGGIAGASAGAGA